MSNYSKYNIVYRLQKWMDTVPGQTFLNYAYSWGASVVILGALFKLTHLPGANLMLFLGMGTEVVVFFISAFDRPFDKTADGRDLPTHITEEYLETGKVVYGEDGQKFSEMPEKEQKVAAATAPVAAVASQPQPNYVPQMSVEEAEAFNEAQGSYVEELKKLVETLQKVNDQSSRLTRDSEEMENLNRTLTGIAKVYEMQLKGASQQIGTIDQINEQSKKMAQHIEQLNKIYTRMIEAMTVNMKVAAPGASATEG
ncbi:gliding motility protein GldL [Prevotella sp. KH2C16]|uniref:type IX secretion system motor protein PorL/GldL n=1 Tax=Prevotella sp. KH2C16 TaxID=1855325 RepID=UPI0008F1B50C|nr:gliding motility protein GldL [Prevotella sp. KH2C16]SFG58216.1 gliding motility-associated protein GldL [Prevotella sp. KH2C16]